MNRVLIVDDEKNVRDVLKRVLEKEGFKVSTAGNGEEGLTHLRKEPSEIILVDIKMPVMDGMEFLRRMGDEGIDSVVIMMSAFGTVKTVVQAVKMGAYSYVSKPFDLDEILLVIQKALEEKRLRKENERLRNEIEKKYSFQGIVGKSKGMQEVFGVVEKVKNYNVAVLIMGESGTGKELIARALHFGGDRKENPFVAVNCAALPENLIETELFGYKKGAFTGARNDKRGLIEEGDHGTLFLDEISEIPLPMQAKLLRFLQEGEIRRVGDTENRKVDVRVISATSKKLQEGVKGGGFREDLFYRLNKVVIEVPPLRERLEDIPLLAEHFIKHFSVKADKNVMGFSEDGYRELLRYGWPGNVRELENVIERAVLMGESELLASSDLSLKGGMGYEEEPSGDTSFEPGKISLKEALKIVEKEMIGKALIQTEGSRPGAAKVLGISHPALLYKIKEYNIN